MHRCSRAFRKCADQRQQLWLRQRYSAKFPTRGNLTPVENVERGHPSLARHPDIVKRRHRQPQLAFRPNPITLVFSGAVDRKLSYWRTRRASPARMTSRGYLHCTCPGRKYIGERIFDTETTTSLAPI